MAETDVGRLEQDVADIKADVQSLGERMARLEGGFEQMNERLGNVEQGQRELAAALRSGQHWLVGLVLGAWLTLGMGVVGLFLRGTP